MALDLDVGEMFRESRFDGMHDEMVCFRDVAGVGFFDGED